MRGHVTMQVDGAAVIANWRTMALLSGNADCAAVVKADGYGLGARRIVELLADAGCRNFFVARWAEAAALMPWPGQLRLAVFHGVSPGEMAQALQSPACPVLNSAAQVAAWYEAAGGPFMAMIDTGISRLGLSATEVQTGALDSGMPIALLSHLANAEDEDAASNAAQLALFEGLTARLPGIPRSIANSAGIALGARYLMEMTRTGIALYGGASHPALDDVLRPVVAVKARILQRRRLSPGESVGYGSTFTATRTTEIALIDCGYADGYGRHFSNLGRAIFKGDALPVAGIVSMDMTAIVVDACPELAAGDEVDIDFDLVRHARDLGRSPYELLTTMAPHCRKIWNATPSARPILEC